MVIILTDDEYDMLESMQKYSEFLEEYGWRKEWNWNFNDPEFTSEWNDWKRVFDSIKKYWNTKSVKYWREKLLQQFAYNLRCKNSESLLHAFITSDLFKLSHILSLTELTDSDELSDEIWPDGIYNDDEIKEIDNKPSLLVFCSTEIKWRFYDCI